MLCLVQVLDELKQRELRNSEREEETQVKKKTIDLLPDADDNQLKLQVGGPSGTSDTAWRVLKLPSCR